ncbi:hypothetical protein Clacol_010341 [Clathrus columnatus]|uniref:Uncharacterized protein n=1 Tax=Clathrus columnatus TaxID=1419009 RepID=A0AAV5AQL9_9AGAM|nr:hypothetical protein Clacol_010341 [Clathrus columnatus]
MSYADFGATCTSSAPGNRQTLVFTIPAERIILLAIGIFSQIHNISLILLETLTFIALIRQIWGLWKLKKSLGLRNKQNLTTLLIQQERHDLSSSSTIVVSTITILWIANTVLTRPSQIISYSFKTFSTLLICELTIHIRRKNQQNAVLNQSALNLPTISFHENPVQSIRSALGRLHESIVVEMGERSDQVNVDELGSGEPNYGLRDGSPGPGLVFDMNFTKDYDQVRHA